MALPPGILRENPETRIKAAEVRIDESICRATRLGPIVVRAISLNISREEWDKFLAPKYLAAGWTLAEWVCNQQDGSFVQLSAW